MKKSGFTLIELLITVTIVSLLSGLVMINIYGNLAKARDAKRKNDLREIKTSLDLYYNTVGNVNPGTGNIYPPSQNSSWPPNFSGTETIYGCGTVSIPESCPWGSPWVQTGVTYMGSLPTDPKASQSYFYMRAPSGRLSYLLIAKLERDFDPDIQSSKDACKSDPSDPIQFDYGGSSNAWYVVCDTR